MAWPVAGSADGDPDRPANPSQQQQCSMSAVPRRDAPCRRLAALAARVR